jgi:hypothetical protein
MNGEMLQGPDELTQTKLFTKGRRIRNLMGCSLADTDRGSFCQVFFGDEAKKRRLNHW